MLCKYTKYASYVIIISSWIGINYSYVSHFLISIFLNHFDYSYISFQSSYNKLPITLLRQNNIHLFYCSCRGQDSWQGVMRAKSPSGVLLGEPPFLFLVMVSVKHSLAHWLWPHHWNPSSLLTSSFPVLSAASLLCVIWTLAIRFKTYPCDIRWSPLRSLTVLRLKRPFCQIT